MKRNDGLFAFDSKEKSHSYNLLCEDIAHLKKGSIEGMSEGERLFRINCLEKHKENILSYAECELMALISRHGFSTIVEVIHSFRIGDNLDLKPFELKNKNNSRHIARLVDDSNLPTGGRWWLKSNSC